MNRENAILRVGCAPVSASGGVLRVNLFLAYSSDGEPKERCGEEDNSVDYPPLGIPVPLNITCGNKEGQKYTYRVVPGSTQE